jgi:hypothetical protein
MSAIDRIKTSSIFTGIGSIFGGAIGGVVAGPVGAMTGVQIGGSAGFRAAAAGQVEKASDEIGKKICEGLDAGGRKFGEITDRSTDCCGKIMNVAAIGMLAVGDILSKMIITGYALNIGMYSLREGLMLKNDFCKNFYDSIDCVALSLTTLSLNSFIITTAACGAYEIYKKTFCEKEKSS